MGFKDSWWTIFVSSLVILAAAGFEIMWKDRQTNATGNLTPLTTVNIPLYISLTVPNADLEAHR